MASMAAQPVSTSHPRILRRDEVLLRLGCGRSTLHRLGKAGILPQADRMEGCSSAGWLEDDVDALVESRRPAGKKPVTPAGSAPAKSTQADTCNGIEDSVVTAPVAAPADSNTVGAGKTTSDLVPTTLQIMGNVVYLHPPTRKLLLEVGNLSGPGRGVNLDMCAIAATADETVESADFRATTRKKQKGKYQGRMAGGI